MDTRKDPGYPLGGMTVDGSARRADVLPPDVAGFAALLEDAGLVHDQDAARCVPAVRHEVAAQPAQRAPGADAIGMPRCGVQEALHALRH
jgi:hypothetical protein